MPQRDTAVRIINSNANLLSPLITRMFNEHIGNYIFSGALKFSNISQYKGDNQHEKKNCRPVSILPIFSKVFDWCLYDQYLTPSIPSNQSINLRFEKDAMLSIHWF